MEIAPLNPRQELERFRHMVLEDDPLLKQLRQTDGLESFAVLAVALGRERGCVFSLEDVRAAVQEARRTWLERWI